MVLFVGGRHHFFQAFMLLFLSVSFSNGYAEENALRHYKILHVMSYHSPWRWTDDQLQGFKDGLGDASVEFKVLQMDTKHNSTLQAKRAKADEAKAMIKRWRPDLVYTTDDDAQQFVSRFYINSNIPFVFSGVNKAPGAYGFEHSENITGVLEYEHFVGSMNLLRAISPKVKRLAVVFDDAPMWPPTKARIKEGLKKLPDVELVAWDDIKTFKEYKQKMAQYQSTVDAVALIGIFNFKDEAGENVPYKTVLEWTAENSQLPDFSFWVDRVHHGTLCAVTVSGKEQGYAAGQMARQILVEGIKARKIPFKPTARGVPVINLARAQKLGIKVKSTLLLSAEIIQDFEWDK